MSRRSEPKPSDPLEGSVTRALRASVSIGEIVSRLRGDLSHPQVSAHQVRSAVLALERDGVLTRDVRDGVAVFRLREEPRTAVHKDAVSLPTQPRQRRTRKRRRILRLR